MPTQLEAGGPATTEVVEGLRPPMDRMLQGMCLLCQVELQGLEHAVDELAEDMEEQRVLAMRASRTLRPMG